MSPKRFLCVSLFLICIFGFSEAEYSSKQNAEMLTNLFANEKWKKLKDVKEVLFYNKLFSLETNFEKNIDLYNCNNKVRAATLVLGCSYVKDLKTFYFMFQQFRNYCAMLYGHKNLVTYGCDCTKKLLILINKLNSLVKIMQGALKALDIMHSKPWDDSKEHDFFFIRLLSVLLKNHEVLKITFLIDPIITQQSLKTITTFLKEKVDLIDYRSKHCDYIPYNLNEMWQKWNEEHGTITNLGDKLSFFDYLSRKLHDTIKHTMVDKFIDLGFKYESSAQKIVVPIPLNYVVDIQPNYTFTEEMIALVQNESNKYTKLKSCNKELEVPDKNTRTPELINFFQEEVPSGDPKTPEFIDFLEQVSCNKELEVPDVNPTMPEQINFFQEEVPSGDPKTPEFIDFLEQGLNPEVSPEDILEPMDIDKKKIFMFNFL